MLNKLLKTRRAIAAPRPAIPEGQRVYAIGDVHGCDALLETLLAKIEADDAARGPAETTLIFLGDLVDRGPASAQVIERLRRLKETRPTTRYLMGNHDELFLRSVEGDERAMRFLCRFGGRETALSYGIAADHYERLDYAELAALLAEVVPAAHREFIATFEDLIEIGGYAFVHAGVDPDLPFARQEARDLRWIREPFLDHGAPLEKMVVHGHTVSDEVEFLHHRIGIDTGAYASGVLTALGLEGGTAWRLQT